MRNSALQLLEVDDHHAMGIGFNMGFVLWVKETQLLTFRRLDVALSKLARANPEGVGVCQIIESSAEPPSTETRARISEMMRQGAGGNLRHYSVVYEGAGFKAAAVRAVVAASQMIARTTTQLGVFNSVAAAALWHAKQQQALGRKETADDISAVMLQLRREFEKSLGARNRLHK